MKPLALLLVSAAALCAAPVTVAFAPDPQIVYPGWGANFIFGEIDNPNPEILLLNRLTGPMGTFIEDFGIFGGGIFLNPSSTRTPVVVAIGGCMQPQNACPLPGTYSGDITFEWRRISTLPGSDSDYISPTVNLALIVSDVVPEPATWGFMALGLAGLALRRKLVACRPTGTRSTS